MLISTVSPHLGNSASIIQQSIARCWDRKCQCNKRRTRQLLQEDYEAVNTGSEFELDVRYSQFLTTLFMVFMYSSGIPILYPIAFIFFFFTYWFDKMFCKTINPDILTEIFLVLKWHKRPPSYTLHLSSKTRMIMKFCLIPHFFLGLYMYTNSSILTPSKI